MIRILASDLQKAELQKNEPDESAITWVKDLNQLLEEPAETYVDLLFEPTSERITQLKLCIPSTVIIHSVTDTLDSLALPFVRINAWPGFLERLLVECSVHAAVSEDALHKVSACLKRQFITLPDQPGFISARILAMIINEAYFALQEGVSSKTEIDIAMKTGTNYPYGPFEWSHKIGIAYILQLLVALEKLDSRYQPCALMVKEALIMDQNPTY